MAWNKKIGVPSEPGSRGSRFRILVDKLTLMQSEGADYAHHISKNTSPRIYWPSYSSEEEELGFKGKATLMKNSIENYPLIFKMVAKF